MQNEHLYYYNNIIVSNSELLQFKILKFIHNAAIARHSDWAKTYKIVQQSYY